MPRPKPKRGPGRPLKPRKKKKKSQSRKVPDYVTGLYVISVGTPAGDKILSKSGEFVADLNEARTFKTAVLARIELKHMIEDVKEDVEESKFVGWVLEDLQKASVEPFKTYAAMRYTFDEKGNLTSELVPFNEGKPLKHARKEALQDHIQLVKLAEEDLRSFHRRNKPEEKKLTKTLTEAQLDLEHFERKLRAYGKV